MPPEAPTTVLDAVRLLDAEGYGAQFVLGDDGLRCTACGNPHSTNHAEVLRVYRFEGPSDPDEEAVVYGLRCPVCGAGGRSCRTSAPASTPSSPTTS